MENKQPLLSICIPTYNRCEYLQGALCNITSEESFDCRAEIIISDNASTDRTQEIGEEFANKHNNIMYYRNNCNIRDENLFLSLQRAHGKYVRLFNDTLRFKNGALKRMLQAIESMSESSLLLFFQNISFINSDKKINIYDVNQFIANTSFYITWIGNFGIWRKNIDLIQDFNRYPKMHLPQVDWYLQIVSKSDGGILYYSDFFESIAPKQKGGYNLFEVFINNYLLILHSYLDKKIKSLILIEREKYRLFRYHILPWYLKLIIRNDQSFSFDTHSANSIIFKKYWYCPYLYIGILFVFYKKYIENS